MRLVLRGIVDYNTAVEIDLSNFTLPCDAVLHIFFLIMK